ncbi:hypothetical protein GCM10027589_07620 [Actinocorallia lasiicapitis]
MATQTSRLTGRSTSPSNAPLLTPLPVLLTVAALLLAAFAFWSHGRAETLIGTPAAQNAALTDAVRTSELKGQITDAVNTAFSYNYADPGKAETAAKRLLTGEAVQQYDGMFSVVRKEAVKLQLVLTMTVTDSSVVRLDGDQARMLIFADQSSTSVAKDKHQYGSSMLGLDLLRRDGHWQITAIDTFGAS